MKMRENKGVTLIALMITIVILLIIAGIAIYSGKDIIRRADLEALRTNMLLVEAKARGLVEEANFQLGPNFDYNLTDTESTQKMSEVRTSIYVTENKLQKLSETSVSIPSGSNIPTGDNVYVMTEETYALWELKSVYNEFEDGEVYLIAFDEQNAIVEIYNTLGYQGNYSLTQIDNLEE